MKRRDHPVEQQQALFHKKRREKYLEDQKESRSDLLERLRQDDVREDTLATRKKAQREWWSSQCMVPEWMVDVPTDLGSSWIVMPRPEGQRCLVILSHGMVVVRNSFGAIVDTFPSTSLTWARDHGPHKEYILDCILQDDVFFIMDVLCWGGLALLDCTAEFRMFWKTSTIASELDTSIGQENLRFFLVKHYNATPEGLQAAYGDAMPYQRDGMVFLHKLCCYHGGQSPLMLRWKDQMTSRYYIDTDAEGRVLPEQIVILSYAGGQSLVTGDDCPFHVAMLPSSLVEACSSSLCPGRLLKFKLPSTTKEGLGAIQITNDGNNVWLSLEYLGTAHRRRRHADTMSKIMFQYMARHAPLSFETLCSMSSKNQMVSTAEGHASYSIGCAQ